MSKILLVEDEDHIAEGIKINLELEGYECTRAKDGASALNLWKNEYFNLIVLDLMIPKISGEQVLEAIREKDDQVPILVLTAKDAQRFKNDCFKNGVDDYLTKPFDLEEFLLRIQRLIKRCRTEEVEEIKFGPNKVDLISGQGLTRNGNINFTPQETKLLRFFFQNPGKPISRQDLITNALGYDSDMSTRTVDNFIVRFRKYFEKDPKNPIYFKSLRSVGYIFDKEPEDDEPT